MGIKLYGIQNKKETQWICKKEVMMKKIRLMFVLSMFLVVQQGYANQHPVASLSDPRIKLVTYRNNDVIPIRGTTFTATQIIFSKNEYVLDIEGGDTQGWIVHAPESSTLANMLFIKPTMINVKSNITVVTNKHTYYFHVTSNSNMKDEGDMTYAIKFTYPEEERLKLKYAVKRRNQKASSVLNKKREPKQYNWQYSFNGSHQIMPLHVFDDGTFTYFEMRQNQAMPAIFLVEDRNGKESVVNTRIEGKYLITTRTAPQFTLRSGKAVASVFNTQEIAHRRRRRV